MKPHRLIFIIVALLVLWSDGKAQSSYQIFLKMEGLQGSSTDAHHLNWCEVISFQLGDTNAVSGTGSAGGGAGRARLLNLVVLKQIDKTSPLLTLRCAKGERFTKVTLVCAKPGNNPLDFYKVTLFDVLVSGVRVSGDVNAPGTMPVESVSFSYQKVKWEFVEQNPNGTTGNTFSGEWNAKTGTGH